MVDDALRPGGEPVPGYTLIDRLGRGGFGEVWEAEGPGGFRVALKFVRLAEEVGPTELRALQVIRDVRHPHLLATFGSWQVDNHLIIVMELAERTLYDRFKEAVAQGHPGIPAPEVHEHFLDAARGLDYLNEARFLGAGELQGIQHRDVKPQNLLLVGGGIKVADFGLARILEHTLTGHTGSMTPLYAAPEFFHKRTSAQSDQYSLAATYCHVRGGRPPFTGNIAALALGHTTLPPDLTMLPGAERPAVARALAKEPKDRWRSCRTFVEAVLAGRAEARPVAIPPLPDPPPPAPAVDPRRPTDPALDRSPTTVPKPPGSPPNPGVPGPDVPRSRAILYAVGSAVAALSLLASALLIATRDGGPGRDLGSKLSAAAPSQGKAVGSPEVVEPPDGELASAQAAPGGSNPSPKAKGAEGTGPKDQLRTAGAPPQSPAGAGSEASTASPPPRRPDEQAADLDDPSASAGPVQDDVGGMMPGLGKSRMGGMMAGPEPDRRVAPDPESRSPINPGSAVDGEAFTKEAEYPVPGATSLAYHIAEPDWRGSFVFAKGDPRLWRIDPASKAPEALPYNKAGGLNFSKIATGEKFRTLVAAEPALVDYWPKSGAAPWHPFWESVQSYSLLACGPKYTNIAGVIRYPNRNRPELALFWVTWPASAVYYTTLPSPAVALGLSENDTIVIACRDNTVRLLRAMAPDVKRRKPGEVAHPLTPLKYGKAPGRDGASYTAFRASRHQLTKGCAVRRDLSLIALGHRDGVALYSLTLHPNPEEPTSYEISEVGLPAFKGSGAECLAFTPIVIGQFTYYESDQLAFGAADGKVRLVRSMRRDGAIAEVDHGAPVHDLAYDADGSHLAVLSGDGKDAKLTVWRVSSRR